MSRLSPKTLTIGPKKKNQELRVERRQRIVARLTLTPIEIDALGDVTGVSLLHLQCHFGLDTLSWARRGAEVTGVDFSARAIEFARALARELALPARFVQSDIYDLPAALQEEFDVVFTSYGVVYWLPDLPRWAAVAARL